MALKCLVVNLFICWSQILFGVLSFFVNEDHCLAYWQAMRSEFVINHKHALQIHTRTRFSYSRGQLQGCGSLGKTDHGIRPINFLCSRHLFVCICC